MDPTDEPRDATADDDLAGRGVATADDDLAMAAADEAALHWHAAYGRTARLALLAAGAAVDSVCNSGWTPLH